MTRPAVIAISMAGLLATACAAPQSSVTPTSTPTSVPTAAAGPTPTPTPTLAATVLPAYGAVAAGRYYVDSVGYRYTFTVSGSAAWARTGDAPDVLISHGTVTDDDFAVMWLWGPLPVTDTIYRDPCHWRGTDFNPGPSVADYATALTTIATWHATTPTDVTVGGRQGKQLELIVPADANFALCDGGELHLSAGRWYQKPGQTEDMRILDFDGNRYLILTSWFPTTPTDIQTQLNQMVESMAIDTL